MVVAAATVLVPLFALAGNQEVAERIANSLRQSGQLKDYKVGVKFQDGTAWVRGRVTDREQMNTALRLVMQTPGVERVVNNLAVGAADQAAQSPASGVQQLTGAFNPERSGRLASQGLNVPSQRVEPSAQAPRADRVPATFTPAPVQQVAVEQPRPVRQIMQPAPQPMAVAYAQPVAPAPLAQPGAAPMPQYVTPVGGPVAPARYDQPYVPNYTWPSYAAYPNYASLTYPKQYSPTAWPYIGPFYPYPQVPLGWRKVTLEWHDGWWQLDFCDRPRKGFVSGLFRPCK
jgi:hypothetical protein